MLQVAPSGTNEECVAACANDCEEAMYQYIPSYVSLLSQNTVDRLYQVMDSVDHIYTNDDLDREGNPPQWNASTLTDKFFMDNIVALEIGYSHFNVDTFESTPNQTFSSFVSTIGGLLGLVAGISFMTIYEFLEYPFVKLMSYVSKNRTSPGIEKPKRIQPAPNHRHPPLPPNSLVYPFGYIHAT